MSKIEILTHLSAEIEQANRDQKKFKIQLMRKDEHYQALSRVALEGDCTFIFLDGTEKQVAIERDGDLLKVRGLDNFGDSIEGFITKSETSLLKMISKNIESSGAEAISFKPSFIIGPPGTGKTKVITNILKEAWTLGKKVLVVSPTHNAVENVFERMELKDIEDGEVVLTIDTNDKRLAQFKAENIKEKKIIALKDEKEILEDAWFGLVDEKKKLEPIVYEIDSRSESQTIQLSNIQKEIVMEHSKATSINGQIENFQHRIKSLQKNKLIASLAKMGGNVKVKELESQTALLLDSKTLVEDKIAELNNELSKLEKKSSSSNKESKKAKLKLEQNLKDRSIVAKRGQEIKKELDGLEREDLIAGAKIVGATLAKAALDKKIQAGNFDLIIVDEAGMAPMSFLVALRNCLKKDNKAEEIKVEDDDELYAAQNEAVELSLNSQITFVGDPRQLSPIGKTYEMRRSVFDHYEIDNIFRGLEVENTAFLDINFRNHPDIVRVASKLYYGGLLKSGKEDDGKKSLFLRRSKSHMVSSQGSFMNQGNIYTIFEQVKLALSRGRRSIGVITPYTKQANLHNKEFEKLKEEYPDATIEAGTIHKFQGRERDVIIFDITYAPNSANDSLPAAYSGNFDSGTSKLLNVAMTRAEQFFIVVGDIDSLVALDDKSLAIVQWLEEMKNLETQKEIA